MRIKILVLCLAAAALLPACSLPGADFLSGMDFLSGEDFARQKNREILSGWSKIGDRICLEEIQGLKAGTVIDPDLLDMESPARYFQIQEIGETVYRYINGKSYVENDHVKLDDLRYLKVLHYNYDHKIQVGELIVNQKIAQDCQNVFYELFLEEYEISSMYLIDKYWTGNGVDTDTNSIADNNTSAFNYRVVPGSNHLSNHAKGFAIDLNPVENPYVTYTADGEFAKYYKDMEQYIDRDSGKPHMITHEDAAFRIFSKYGFSWGGDWVNSKDYQHFEKRE